MPDEFIETIQNIGDDDYSVTVIYRQKPEYAHVSVQFSAHEIVAYGPNADGSEFDVKLYERKGAESSNEHVTDPHEAARYVDGGVKWDGCSHYNFGDENGYLHLCGLAPIQKLAHAIEAIFERCGELMKASGGNLLEGEFKCHPAASSSDEQAEGQR